MALFVSLVIIYAGVILLEIKGIHLKQLSI
jgi:hypothetical protein